ncbi:hypothetical protein PsW64_02127 [Pseudovibrio sp. W64]|uniref:hypothetical protein n=1 Tax=unclassified Pseudovibrio TaxID=2627060 RepID=UPI0007B1C6D0|nr:MULTISPECIES: hypothetical protein [unclassified Pseudovibrio]KZK76610.1 hypothetical protein PsAD46_05369 [Pseudovibrio sp. Ad46]KZK79930.1 hypothetical protein PsAD13_04920 [Pseudovibrio sp. Ad13]KZK83959.1 hypothetical protein PsW64_02127 [Pseudovibrio sp. W64]KZL01476.1 hypothetical protein PsAD5_00711 [Pseudovibrio sp. Ad5]
MTDLNKLHAAAQNPFTHKAITPTQKAKCGFFPGGFPFEKIENKTEVNTESKD